MNQSLQDLMQAATRLTRAGSLKEATALIQRTLRRSSPAVTRPTPPLAGSTGVLEDCVVELPRESPGPGTFSAGTHSHASLTRHYKLFVPTGPEARPRALVVMLHGCTQDPDDFATGTGMNDLALEQGFCVLYPAQAQDANPSRCWNWFKHNHQGRERGEAAVIASMTQAAMRAQDIDPGRVFIAGLSAGGAMAALVAAAYPEVFAAVGIHSGLAPGAASTLPEGLSAMRSGGRAPTDLPVPAIVFHGDQDSTVHARNGEQAVAAVLASSLCAEGSSGRRPVVEQGQSAQGSRYTRAIHRLPSGRVVAEHWVVHGAGHAWSGGRAAGSYTDPRGPDASREMLRFFSAAAA